MSFNLGYDIGIMSGAKRLIEADLQLSDWQVSLLVGSLNLISGVGGLLSGQVADAIGRRRTILLSCVVCIAAPVLMAAAEDFNVLMMGRILAGIGIGSAFQISPLYIAEVAPKQIRGKLVSSFDLFINIGILGGYIGGWVLSGLPTGVAWRAMLGLGALPPLLILLFLPWLLESPRYLLAKGREAEAEQVIRRIYSEAEAQATLSLLRAESERGKQPAGARAPLLPPPGVARKLLLVGLGVACCQQATGVEAAVYYTPETLEAAGIRGENLLHLATIVIGLVKVVFIALAAQLVDRLGRVPLLVISNVGIALAQFLIATSFAAASALGEYTGLLALLGQCLFMAAFSIGVGPCTMMVASECFPLQSRGLAMGVATFINRCTSGAVALSFLSLTTALTPSGTFYMFCGVALLAAGFTKRCVPETRGRSLEELFAPRESPPATPASEVPDAALKQC